MKLRRRLIFGALLVFTATGTWLALKPVEPEPLKFLGSQKPLQTVYGRAVDGGGTKEIFTFEGHFRTVLADAEAELGKPVLSNNDGATFVCSYGEVRVFPGKALSQEDIDKDYAVSKLSTRNRFPVVGVQPRPDWVSVFVLRKDERWMVRALGRLQARLGDPF